MYADAAKFSTNPIQPVSIEYHEMMAKIGSVGRAVSTGANYFGIAKDLWSLSRRFADLLVDANQLKRASEADLADILAKFQELHRGLASLADLSEKKGLLKRSLTAASIRSVISKNEELQDLIDSFELSLRASTKEDLEAAMHEYDGGQTVSLESLMS